jgi:NADPH:quinone reductase-like Zn-dependent oxidoreductase
MKAAVYTRYGCSKDVVQIVDQEKPAPKDNQVLLKVRAASINPGDWRLLNGVPYIFRFLFRVPGPSAARPGHLGHDVAGEVHAVGKNVTRFKPSDAVFGWCKAALAEYACTSESSLLLKLPNVTFEQAAAVPVAALTALQGLRDKGKIQPQHKVLINGAAGGVGTFAVQIAKSFGANVTGVCGTRNVDMVRSLGADHVIDYTREDFIKNAQRYDLILDNVGNHSLSELRRVLNPKGICVVAGAPKKVGFFFLMRWLTAPLLSRFVSQTFVVFIARLNEQDLSVMNELMAAGKVTPVIDRRYPLDAAAAALQYLEEGHARGKVIITVA